MSLRVRYVDLADAGPDQAVVVIDVLRAFTTVAWLFERGVTQVLAVDERDRARRLRDDHVPDALLAGESGGRPLPDFDLGNSPTDIRDAPADRLAGRPVVQRTSAGTQGLVRAAASPLLLAASFVTAGATAAALRAAHVDAVTFVVTGASLGRNGDEDLAAAELIAARVAGDDPDPTAYVARVAASDAGRVFAPDGEDWAPPSDLALACEVDRFDRVLVGEVEATLTGDGTPVVRVTRREGAAGG
ncbi:2-phosphosulfolactate phosphatase [Nitriliruptoraceae bacterium ZYF776]|nr:2-phosphosulfolactate phosphatase [Profundirhabdus halotolerans]